MPGPIFVAETAPGVYNGTEDACGGRVRKENPLGYGLRGDITPARDHLPTGRESGGS